MAELIPDWRPDRWIDPRTRKKVVFVHGLGTASGAPTFAPIERDLFERGFGPHDLLELSPRFEGGAPRVWTVDDLRRPIADSISDMAACLGWYLDRLPADQEIHLIGYSLGGVLAVRAVAAILADRLVLSGPRLGSLITLNAPLEGLPADTPGIVGRLLEAGRHLPEIEGLLDPVIRDLIAEGRDPAAEIDRRIEFETILGAGIRICLVGSLDDQIVSPTRIAPELPGLERVEIVNDPIVRPTLQIDRLIGRIVRAGQEYGLPLPGLDRPGAASYWLGHSPILSDPAARLAVWEHVGRQAAV